MYQLFNLVTVFLCLQIARPCLAINPENLEPKHYYIIGGAAGGILLLLICCCCCCCRKKKKSDKGHTPLTEIRTSEPTYETGTESEQCSSPVTTTLLVEPASPRHPVADFEHLRRLDAILTTQMTAVGTSQYEQADNTLLGNSGQALITESQSSPPANNSQGNSDTLQDHNHVFGNKDSVMASFQRVLPSGPAPSQRSRREVILAQRDDEEETPEFMGIKLKPIVLNKSGGLYIPPEDF